MSKLERATLGVTDPSEYTSMAGGGGQVYWNNKESLYRPFTRFERPAIEKAVNSISGDRYQVVELGSGCGQITQMLIENGQSPYRIVGIEPDAFLQKKLTQAYPGVRFVRGYSSDAVSGRRSIFQLAIAHMVLNHIDEEHILPTLVDMRNMLAKGGRFLIMVPDPETRMREYDYDGTKPIYEFIESSPWGRHVVHYCRSAEYLRDLMLSAGFGSVDVLARPTKVDPYNTRLEGSRGLSPYMIKNGYRESDVTPRRLLLRAIK